MQENENILNDKILFRQNLHWLALVILFLFQKCIFGVFVEKIWIFKSFHMIIESDVDI